MEPSDKNMDAIEENKAEAAIKRAVTEAEQPLEQLPETIKTEL